MFIDPTQFYLVRDSSIGSLQTDFDKIVEDLATLGDIFLKKKSDSHVTISYPGSDVKATLETGNKTKLTDTVSSRQLILTCEKFDNISINLLKNITARIGFRIFNPVNQYYMAKDRDLFDLTTTVIVEPIKSILKVNSLVPLFNFRSSLVYYCLDESEKISLANHHLIAYLLEAKLPITKYENMSIVVADDIGIFIALMDRGLVHTNYYTDKLEVMNRSGFVLNPLVNDLFVRPVFFKYKRETQSFVQIKRSIIPRKMIAKGENVLDYPNEITKRLKIEGNIVSTKIGREINFEKDERGKFIPRVSMSIFLD